MKNITIQKVGLILFFSLCFGSLSAQVSGGTEGRFPDRRPPLEKPLKPKKEKKKKVKALSMREGIKGKSEKSDRFYARSFNRRISKKHVKLSGFSNNRMAKRRHESRMKNKAYAYHKRRVVIKYFF